MISRRDFIKSFMAGIGGILLSRCGNYEPDESFENFNARCDVKDGKPITMDSMEVNPGKIREIFMSKDFINNKNDSELIKLLNKTYFEFFNRPLPNNLKLAYKDDITFNHYCDGDFIIVLKPMPGIVYYSVLCHEFGHGIDDTLLKKEVNEFTSHMFQFALPLKSLILYPDTLLEDNIFYLRHPWTLQFSSFKNLDAILNGDIKNAQFRERIITHYFLIKEFKGDLKLATEFVMRAPLYFLNYLKKNLSYEPSYVKKLIRDSLELLFENYISKEISQKRYLENIKRTIEEAIQNLENQPKSK